MICVLRRVVAIGMLVSMSAPALVYGDPAPAADKKQLAKQYVGAGVKAQEAGDYDTAITLYQKAYQLVPHPLLIFNIAQAHRLAGRPKEALTLYKRFVADAPEDDRASFARDFIAEIEAQQAAAAPRDDGAATGTRSAVPPPPLTTPAPPAAVESTHAPGVVVASDTHARPSRIPLVVAGGGAVLLVGAASVYLWANSTYDDAKAEQVIQARRDSLYDSANTRRHIALAMTGAGLACGGVAAWLYFRHRGEPQPAMSARAHVLPLIGGSAAGLAVLAGF